MRALVVALLLFSFPQKAEAQRFMVSGNQAMEPVAYEVRTGDTLWELCDDFYADPYFWTRVWARNPQLTNPHWIYPGDVLEFPPLEEFEKEMKAEASAGTETEERKKEEEKAKAKIDKPAAPKPGGARIRFVPKAWEHQVFVRFVGFLTDEELEEAGTIRWSREERLNLGELDEVYIDFRRLPRVRPGDRWSVLAVRKKVIHPIFENEVGSRIEILGVLEITAVDEFVARGILIRSYKEIERGAIVSPLIPNFRSVRPRQNRLDVDGYVIDTHAEGQALADQDVVFVDRGTKDGVEVGNRFVIFRRGDGYFELEEEEQEKLPWEPISEVMVVETKDRYATAIVINTIKEIRIGDFCRMRKLF